MFLKPVFISSAGRFTDKVLHEKDATYAIRLTPEALWSAHNSVFETYFQSPDPCSVCLDLTKTKRLTEQELQLIEQGIARVSFSPSYLKHGDAPVILLLTSQDSDQQFIDLVKKRIESTLLAQGFELALLFALTDGLQNIQQNVERCYYLNLTHGDLPTNLVRINELYEENIVMNAFFFMNCSENTECFQIIQEIVLAEQRFAARKPTVYALMQQLQALEAERDLLISENKRTQVLVQDGSNYLKQLKQDAGSTILWWENENQKIIRFYQTEYESLPLWYKRFGHLIKKMF